MTEQAKPPEPFPLYALLNEINAAAANGAPFLAVAMCVSLPDICVSLVSEDGRTNSTKYKNWCDDNLGEEFNYLTSDDLYSMRCGVLHNGRFGDMQHSVAKVIFALPGGMNIVNCMLNDAYFYSVEHFCSNFTNAVFRWVEANRNNQILQANADRLMQYREGGLPPYIVGTTVLA